MIRILLTLSVVISLFLSGCASGGKLASGEKLYQLGEYHKASIHFKKAYSHEKNRFYKSRASYFLGMCYLRLNQGKRAATALERAVRNGYTEPEVYLYWGHSLRMVQAYEKAIDVYQKYLEYDVGNVVANNAITSCRMVLNNPRETRYQVEEVKDLNSRYSDFSPAFDGADFSTLYFSSMRKGGKKKKNTSRITGQGSSMVYYSWEQGGGQWEDPQSFTGDVSVTQEDGTLSFTGDGKELYFTRCPYLEEGPSGSTIWMMKKMGGRWGNPAKLELGPDSLVFAHPAISADGATLVFVSDMPGGQGGKDLWQIKKQGDGAWGVPFNLGPRINTPGDEMFPYLRSDGRLYFSSNGWVGFGGLDIFEAVQVEEKDWTVHNMGSPVNSSVDDFGIVFRGEQESGFFSSNRNSTRGVDDIFAFQRPSIVPTLKGRVLNPEGNPVEGVVLRLVGNNGTNVRISTQTDGLYQLTLEPDANYVIMASAPGYLNKKEQVSTMGMIESKAFERNMVLESTRSAILFYDLRFPPGEIEVHAQAQENLDRVARILTSDSLYRIQIEVHAFNGKSETNDLIVAQKRADAIESYLQGKGVRRSQLVLVPLGRSKPLKTDKTLAGRYSFLSPGEELSDGFISSLPDNQKSRLLREVNRVHFSLLD